MLFRVRQVGPCFSMRAFERVLKGGGQPLQGLAHLVELVVYFSARCVNRVLIHFACDCDQKQIVAQDFFAQDGATFHRTTSVRQRMLVFLQCPVDHALRHRSDLTRNGLASRSVRNFGLVCTRGRRIGVCENGLQCSLSRVSDLGPFGCRL